GRRAPTRHLWRSSANNTEPEAGAPGAVLRCAGSAPGRQDTALRGSPDHRRYLPKPRISACPDSQPGATSVPKDKSGRGIDQSWPAYRRKYFTATIKSFGQGAVIVWGAPVSGWLMDNCSR